MLIGKIISYNLLLTDLDIGHKTKIQGGIKRMKNFSKKLSFVMATAMVVTSLYTPSTAEAASDKMVVKGSTKAVTAKDVFVGGKTVDFDYSINGKTTGVAGTWSTSDKTIATVDKNGKVKAVSNGYAVIRFTPKSSKLKPVRVKVRTKTRAEKMVVSATNAAVKEGESVNFDIKLELSEKIKAAGGVESTYNILAESSNPEVATVSVSGKKVTVKGVSSSTEPVKIKVYAAQTSSLAKAKKFKLKLEENLEVKVNSQLEAKQIGATKILVTGSNLTTKAAAYVVKNANGVVLNLKDNVQINNDGTAATLEAVTSNVPEGKYTVDVASVGAVGFDIVKAVVKEIVINPSDKAILDSNNKRQAYAYYKVLNNFGEDVTSTYIGANVNVAGSDSATGDSKGKVTFTNATADYQINVSKVMLTLVDRTNGVNASAVLTVVDSSKLAEVEFKGIYDTKNKKFVDTISEAANLNDYKLLFTGKDQYGQNKVVNQAELSRILNLNLVSATGLTATATDSYEAGGTKYIAYNLGKAAQNTVVRAGEVSLLTVSLASGKTSTAKFNVVNAEKVDRLVVSPTAKGVYAGQKNELSFTAYGLDGKAITDYAILSKLNATTNFIGSKLSFERKDGKAVLIYDATAIPSAGIQVLTWLTNTNKFDSIQLNLSAPTHPQSIAGLKAGTAVGVTKGGKLSLKASQVLVKDQYGNDISLDKFANNSGYTIVTTYTDEANVFGTTATKTTTFGDTTATGGAQALTKDSQLIAEATAAGADSASAQVKIAIYQKSNNEYKIVPGSDYTFKISSVKVSDMSNFGVEDIVLQKAVLDNGAYTGEVTTSAIKAYGYKDGMKIRLQSTDYTIFANSDKFSIPADKKNFTATDGNLKLIIGDGKGTNVTKAYSYSNVADKVAKVEKTDAEGLALNNGTITAEQVKAAVVAKTQYGATTTTIVPYITFSELPDGYTVTNNGYTNAQLTGAKAGDTVKVKLVYPSGFTYEDTFVILNQ